VQFQPLLHLPISYMWSDQYLSSRYRKPANFAENLLFFHSHSTNISRIANRIMGGERAARTAQSIYWSCHDTMRTQIHNWRQRCRNCKVWTTVRFQSGGKSAGIYPVRVTNPPRHSGSGFWPGFEPNQTELQAKNRTAGELPGPVGNTKPSSTQTLSWCFTLVYFR